MAGGRAGVLRVSQSATNSPDDALNKFKRHQKASSTSDHGIASHFACSPVYHPFLFPQALGNGSWVAAVHLDVFIVAIYLG
jgi:hypothetical protein